MKALDVESTKIVDLEKFVPGSNIDPVYFDSPYYVYPDGPIGHRQLGKLQIDGKRDGLSEARRYACYAGMATPVTSAQVAKAWVRPDRRLAAVSWSRRRGKTLASWS